MIKSIPPPSDSQIQMSVGQIGTFLANAVCIKCKVGAADTDVRVLIDKIGGWTVQEMAKHDIMSCRGLQDYQKAVASKVLSYIDGDPL